MTQPTGEKWRPSLGLIIFAVLASVAALPLVGLFLFRLYDNQLIHQTQAELIAQSKVLAAVFAREVESRLASGIGLGAEIPPEARPDPLPANAPADQAYLDIGARLMPIILETQKVTLAGFRILDPHGIVVAGRQEVGQSLAHIEEVAAALKGQ